MPQKILINGAGICGPAMATLLLRSKARYDITIVERAGSLRTAGQQIDLRSQGIPIMRKLGLIDAVRAKTVAESGLAFVDTNRNEKAMFGVNDSGKGQQGFTSEYEIMRGDLVEVLVEASNEAARKAEGTNGGSLKYEFGKYATELSQSDGSVTVTFSDGSNGQYDLVIGADGQNSRTRRMAFDKEVNETVWKPFDLFVAYFSIPKGDDDGAVAKVYVAKDNRTITTRSGNRSIAQAYLGILGDTDELRQSHRQPVDVQKQLWTRLFKGAGWETDRILDGMLETDDFYAQQIGQVKMDTWVKGRVVLLGDAGYCPSPITGQGTTASLTGAYVLAGELARHADDIPAALQSYEEVLRPFVNEAQKFYPAVLKYLYPKTQLGVSFLYTVLGSVSWLKIDKVVNKLMPEGRGGWKLPEYPELQLDD